jgi:hypothetical protein
MPGWKFGLGRLWRSLDYWMTSKANCSTEGGMTIPSAWAVFRFGSSSCLLIRGGARSIRQPGSPTQIGRPLMVLHQGFGAGSVGVASAASWVETVGCSMTIAEVVTMSAMMTLAAM